MRVLGLEPLRDRVELATSSGRIRARFVVGADGALSTTARLAGWTDRVHSIPALEAEVRLAPEARELLMSPARFDLGTPAGGYAWMFPKREHLSAGVLSMRRGRELARRAGALSRERRSAARDGGLERESRARGIESIEHHGYVIPIASRASGFARGRVLLAGDAAGLADPLTGEGISYAVRSGEIAARAVIEGGFEPTQVRARQRRLLRESLLPELRIARWLAHVLYRQPKLAARLFERSGQALCEAVTEVVLGNESYRELALNPANDVKLLASRPAGRDRT